MPEGLPAISPDVRIAQPRLVVQPTVQPSALPQPQTQTQLQLQGRAVVLPRQPQPPPPPQPQPLPLPQQPIPQVPLASQTKKQKEMPVRRGQCVIEVQNNIICTVL
eukprot:TRINITY_DN20911_c0_g1_i1.p4 TRINITY_DN20911_c0_g1~~TRINITY_DN20911_c0_g1_i1.p4  ORF type:complete len:106 (+),score=22.71 TRINITY_DN20911_c0_g1_i1:61-378(+)